MNPREISARLHDILSTACRVRQPGPGRPADAGLVGINEVKAGLRDLIREVGDGMAVQLPPRVAMAGSFPEARISGTRAAVEHRRRRQGASRPVDRAGHSSGLTHVSGGERSAPCLCTRAEAHIAAANRCFRPVETAAAGSRPTLARPVPPAATRASDASDLTASRPVRHPSVARSGPPNANGKQDALSPIQPFRRMMPASGHPAHPSADTRPAEIRP